MNPTIKTWPLDRQEEWLERAAIIEFDLGADRDEAERLAFEMVSRAFEMNQAQLGAAGLRKNKGDRR